jgi:DNA polymerase-1
MTVSWNDLADLEVESAKDRKNLLLVDGNNLSYRYIRRANYNSYGDDFVRTVRSLAKSYDACRTFTCFDYGKSYYRMEMFDDYKGNRKEELSVEEQEKKDEFFSVLNVLPEIIGKDVVKLRGVEADDTICYLVEKYKSEFDHVWIVSSDKDLIQLVDDNVSIFNVFSRKEITKDSLFENLQLTPSEFMLSRIIEGDTGDNIIGIEGIGPKRAQALAKQYKTLDVLLKAMPIGGRAKYIQNLNAGTDTLVKNEKLINLKRYNTEAILAGKDDAENLDFLETL